MRRKIMRYGATVTDLVIGMILATLIFAGNESLLAFTPTPEITQTPTPTPEPPTEYSISGYVWWSEEDMEPFFPAQLQLGDSGPIIDNDEEGYYAFSGLAPGFYQVCIITEPPYYWLWNEECQDVSISWEDVEHVDFWLEPAPTATPWPPSTGWSISGTVWIERDSKEYPYPVLSITDYHTYETTGNIHGEYIFGDLTNGDYTVTIVSEPVPGRHWAFETQDVWVFDGHVTGVDFWTLPDPPTPTPTLGPQYKTGVTIQIPAEEIHPGDEFWVAGHLENSGMDVADVPVFFLLEVARQLYFWPSWRAFDPDDPGSMDYMTMYVPHGKVSLDVVPAFVWPDMGDEPFTGMIMMGAMLNTEMAALFGDMGIVSWSYCPI